MPTLHLDIVTAERSLFSDEVDMVTAPGIEGELGILPHHVSLLTALAYGELIARKANEEFSFVISGGFLEVRPDKVVVLADIAERAEEINIERAEAARLRAEEQLRLSPQEADLARAQAALLRATARLRVAERRRRRHS